MAGQADIIFDVDDRDAQGLLDRINELLEPASLAGWGNIALKNYIQDRARKRFVNEGDDAVGRWLPLLPATANIRAMQGYPPDHPINIRTGELHDYITNSPMQIEPLGFGIQATYPGVEATGELGDKFRTAQQGRQNPNTVPRRVIGMSATDMIEILTLLYFYVETGARR